MSKSKSKAKPAGKIAALTVKRMALEDLRPRPQIDGEQKERLVQIFKRRFKQRR